MFGLTKKQKKAKFETCEENRAYDFSTREGRETTAEWLFQEAKSARTVKETEWKRYNDYYNFLHDAVGDMAQAREEMGVGFTPAVVPDPFVMVESQIEPTVPEPEFTGRDTDRDSQKAKLREYAVRYILQNNDIEAMNTANEKRLKKLGDAFWKAYWDETMPCGPGLGDIRVKDIPVEAVYVDPAAGADGLQSGQYVAYVYRIHKIRFWQIYGGELAKRGITLAEMVGRDYLESGGLFELYSGAEQPNDTVDVMEFWFKQPFDTKEANAGAVACTIQAGGREVKYIPNYWRRTGRQNQLFPFVHYWCVRDENEFYNKPELFSILSLVDAADRALATGQLNDAMMANDMIVREEGALADGTVIENIPGSEIVVKQNRINAVRRLGGLHDGVNSLPMVNFMLEQIERANRNYDTNRGKESARVTTASGLAQLRSDADVQTQIKRADRNAGFKRLYELLDYLALEFYDEDRLIFLGAKKAGEEAVAFTYNADTFAQKVGERVDPFTGKVEAEGWDYYPRVDVTVSVGDGIIRSKQATLETLDRLSAISVTEDNYKILSAELEILDIPQKQDILARWERKFAPKVPEAVLQALESDPELLEAVSQAVEQVSLVQNEKQPQPLPVEGMPAALTEESNTGMMAGPELLTGGEGVVLG